MAAIQRFAFFLLMIFCCAQSESYAVEETSTNSENQTVAGEHTFNLADSHLQTKKVRDSVSESRELDFSGDRVTKKRVGKCK